MFKDSKHSYERLDYSKTLYRPIVKFALQDVYLVNDLEDSLKEQSECIVLKEDSEMSLSGRSSSWSTTPEYMDMTNRENVLKYYYEKMNSWYTTYNKLDIRFITLTVPPTQNITVHKKKRQYGTCKIDDQLRYLRNKIYEYFKSCKIEKYVLVFEVTKKMIIHAHMLVCDEQITESYKDLSMIMGYDTYKKMTVNIVEKECDINIIEYLLKIEIIE